jgi:hypothetical protein
MSGGQPPNWQIALAIAAFAVPPAILAGLAAAWLVRHSKYGNVAMSCR